jgi:glycine cleavage system T protein
MSFTPDGFPLLGESAAARNLWLAQAIWVTHSAGCGRALAELMTHGDALLDLHECDPQRFDAHGTSPSYARVRGAQGYREVYDVIHPRQQSEQARGLRTTPFYERQADLGAHFFESAGWERPQWYEANRELLTGEEVFPYDEWAARNWSRVVQAEHRACRDRAGLFDLTPFTKVEVKGPGALAFLQRLAANDVDRAVGVIVYTAMLSPRGGIMCDLTVTRLAEDRFWVVTGGAVGRHDVAWMRRHVPGDGSVVLTDLTSSLCCVGVWGPLARELVGSRTDDDLSNETQPYMRAGTAHIGHVACRLLRVSYVGELGWEIYAPAELGRRLWDTLWDAGRSLGAVACGGAAYDSLRLEKGYRLWGQDIDEEHNPYEAGLGWAVRLGKDTDFIGRDAAAAAAEHGVTRRLSCLVTDDPAVMLVGKEPLLDGDTPVGYVTSAGYGATLGESILYGYLPVERAEPGTVLAVHSAGADHRVTVVGEPRFDPEMARLKEIATAAH